MSTITEQRHLALERANEVRLARAELKRRIARGEVFAASILLDPPEEARTWTVGELLIAQRRWGLSRMRKVLRRLGIAEHAELAGGPYKQRGRRALTDRQRELLARTLGSREES